MCYPLVGGRIRRPDPVVSAVWTVEELMFGKKRPPFVPGGLVAGGEFNVGGDEIIPDEYHEGYIRGYRWWRILNDGTGLAIASLHASYVWGVGNTAYCEPKMTGRRPHDGVSPHPECACGIYAQNPLHTLPEWRRETYGRVSASGSILMSGRIIVCRLGYKTQRALVESPVLIDAQCQADCDNSPEWVDLPPMWQAYSTYCSDHAPTYSAARVDVNVWLRHATVELNKRYPEIEFITPALLEEIGD